MDILKRKFNMNDLKLNMYCLYFFKRIKYTYLKQREKEQANKRDNAKETKNLRKMVVKYEDTKKLL